MRHTHTILEFCLLLSIPVVWVYRCIYHVFAFTLFETLYKDGSRYFQNLAYNSNHSNDLSSVAVFLRFLFREPDNAVYLPAFCFSLLYPDFMHNLFHILCCEAHICFILQPFHGTLDFFSRLF